MKNSKPETQGSSKEGGAAPPSSPIHRTDLWVMALLLVFCGVAYYFTTTFEEVAPLFSAYIPPESFPRLLIWSIVVLSLALPFEHLLVAGGRKGLDEERTERIAPITFLTGGLLLAIMLAVLLFGMVVAMVLVSALLPLLWGERRLKVLIPFVILFPAAVALVFSEILNIYFDPGLLGFAF